jgi:dipeptidyl aminopeptidase/acylaminoacyl peptidase
MITPQSWRCVLLGVVWCAILAVDLGAARGDSDPPVTRARSDQIAGIFRPFQTDRASLAPDGKHVAYEERRDGRLFLILLNLETNRAVELPLTEDRAMPLSGVTEKVPARIAYVGWPTADRVIACVQDEVLVAVDADGRNFRTLLEWKDLEFATAALRERAENLRPRPRNIGFDVSTPDGGPTFRDNILAQREAEFGPPPQFDPETEATEAFQSLNDLSGAATADLFGSGAHAGPVPKIRPVVLDLLLDDADHVLVEARGRAGPTDDSATAGTEPAANAFDVITAVLKVNIRTGRVTPVADEFGTSRIWADREGRARLVLTHFSNERVYKVAPHAKARRVELDRLLGDEMLGFKVSGPSFFSARSVPLGFDYDPNILFYASNVGRDTFGIYALDLTTRRRTEVAIEHPAIDLIDVNDLAPEEVLVFDRFRRKLVGVRTEGLRRGAIWIDRELAAVEDMLKRGTPELDFELIEWDESRRRVLVRASSQSQPGGYYIFDREQKRLWEIAARAPWLSPEQSHAATPFAVKVADGPTVTGYITYPRQVRIEPVPLIVYCHDGPWSRDRPGFDRGAQALASMGFAVLQVNHRGSSGFGRAYLEALRDEPDGSALRDIIAALDWATATHAVSRKRVAILGNGYGGFLALRALQVHPERFRCAVSINAPTDLAAWMNEPEHAFSFLRDARRAFFGTDRARLAEMSPVSHPGAFKAPVLIVHALRDMVVPERHARALRRAMANSAVKPEYLELPAEGHARWLPGSYVRVFERLEEFFVQNIFNFTTQIGEAEVVP